MAGSTLFEVLVFNFWTYPLAAVAAIVGIVLGWRRRGRTEVPVTRAVLIGLAGSVVSFIVGAVLIAAFQQSTPKGVEPPLVQGYLMVLGVHFVLDFAPAIFAFTLAYGLADRMARARPRDPGAAS